MKPLTQLAKALAIVLNIGTIAGLYLADGSPSAHLTAIVTATALVSLIALATAKAGK